MISGYEQIFGKTDPEQVIKEKEEEFLHYACGEAYAALLCAPVLTEQLKEQGMENLFETMEMPLSYVLYSMEKEGILVKREELRNYGEALNGRIQELENAIHTEAGMDFNINSALR